MNLISFEKFKESEHYIVYLIKDRKDKKNKMKIKNKIIVPFPLALWLEDFFLIRIILVLLFAHFILYNI